ncbi:GNAT family N-acetyltransferase [Nocardioides sp. dk4132]|uniref:GNAT family N-acetyltransferase n=1 Tax=unclassified Nocardioides TaxID=2615069 RepID=UPI00129497CD|nr:MULTISPECIES: GNAT family N-acetyltransferase [unclassified Nocardioides]MQW75551.1 GNAT family N-acetyltransferase [Nocardioides sp. dk4132]QGA08462.1 GNAT family N-acetyltransferase [Nocardioides sp. dk884]
MTSERPSPVGDPDLVVRLAVPGDHDAVGELVAAAYADFLLGPDDPYLSRLRDSAARAAEAELWVAADRGGELLGTVTICPDGSPWREIAGPDEGEFRMLAVSPAAQGRGVGARLVELVLQRARAEGRGAVVLSSLSQMRAAHRVYARFGFLAVPERDWQPAPGVALRVFRVAL